MSAKTSGPRVRKFGSPSRASKLSKPGRKVTKSVVRVRPPAKLKKVVGYILWPLKKITPRYFKNAWAELKQVTWPGRRDSVRLTGAVFVFATIFSLLIAGVDKGLDEIFRKVLLK